MAIIIGFLLNYVLLRGSRVVDLCVYVLTLQYGGLVQVLRAHHLLLFDELLIELLTLESRLRELSNSFLLYFPNDLILRDLNCAYDV